MIFLNPQGCGGRGLTESQLFVEILYDYCRFLHCPGSKEIAMHHFLGHPVLVTPKKKRSSFQIQTNSKKKLRKILGKTRKNTPQKPVPEAKSLFWTCLSEPINQTQLLGIILSFVIKNQMSTTDSG